MRTSSGVDFDARCKKYRARITRHCCVYHLGYFTDREKAVQVRKEAERLYEKGKRFKYIHCYSTTTSPTETEDDPYLYFLSYFAPEPPENAERSLRLAVLLQAVKDYLTEKDARIQQSARDWFNRKIESPPTYSFEEILELFGLDEIDVRRYLRKAARNKQQALRQMGRRLVRANSTAL